MPDDIESLVTLRRAQLAELKAMHADGHTGAADSIARIKGELASLGVEAEPDDQADDSDAGDGAPPTGEKSKPRPKPKPKPKARR